MELLERREIYTGNVVSLRVDTLRTADGPHPYEIVLHAPAVVIVARPSPQEIILVHQHRAPLDAYTWEAPAGGVEPGEAPEVAAARELREETGYRAGSLRRLWAAYSAPGFCSELLHFYEATDLIPGPTENDFGEHTTTRTFSLEEAWGLIESDALRDAKTQIAVLWSLRQAQR